MTVLLMKDFQIFICHDFNADIVGTLWTILTVIQPVIHYSFASPP